MEKCLIGCGQVNMLVMIYLKISDAQPNDKDNKLDNRAKKAIFLGYEKGVKGYLWILEDYNFVISRDVTFDKKNIWCLMMVVFKYQIK